MVERIACFVLLLIPVLMIANCVQGHGAPMLTREGIAVVSQADGTGGGDAGAFDPSVYPCECQSDLGPVPHGPLSIPYTGIPPVPCAVEADCQPDSVKACRHAKCNTDCGYCVFVGYPPCMLDTCTMPGHHSTCATDGDCIAAPYYGTHCDEASGKCLIEPPTESGFYCAGPGDLRNVGD